MTNAEKIAIGVLTAVGGVLIMPAIAKGFMPFGAISALSLSCAAGVFALSSSRGKTNTPLTPIPPQPKDPVKVVDIEAGTVRPTLSTVAIAVDELRDMTIAFSPNHEEQLHKLFGEIWDVVYEADNPVTRRQEATTQTSAKPKAAAKKKAPAKKTAPKTETT